MAGYPVSIVNETKFYSPIYLTFEWSILRREAAHSHAAEVGFFD